MRRARAMNARPGRWARAGLWAGLLTSVHVPLGIGVIELAPTVWAAYPLLVLPLLLAGPLTVGRRRVRWGALWQVALGAAIAGVVSGTLTAVSFAVAWWLLGDWFWMLTSAAGAPPMPPLPRLAVLPMDWFTWAHQDILFFQPPLAVALALLTVALRPLGGWLGQLSDRALPRSIGGRLRLAFGALTLLALALGMVGFGMIEEMHIRGHHVQLRADWQRQLGQIRVSLDEELAARLNRTTLDPMLTAARSEQIDRIYQGLAGTGQRPGLSARPEDVRAALATYREHYDEAVADWQAFQAAARSEDSDPSMTNALLGQAIGSLGTLQSRVEADLVQTLASNDVTHHQRLIVVMGLVALVAGLSLWTGERVLDAVGAPLTALGEQLRQVARGDFSRRAPVQGPLELRQLGASVNAMTADLARLYEVERERRAMAEAIATREQELSAAKEFWTNTLVHDLKNPLGLIVGWTELLEHGSDAPLSPSAAQAVRQIRAAANMLDDLVADINDSFRMQAMSLPIHRVALAPGDLLHEAVREYRALGRQTPDVEVEPGLPAVAADARLVGRVLHNLIGNAYKHGGRGARVVLVAEATDSGAAADSGAAGQRAGVVRFAVDDDGRGIPEGERERVFERFIQGEDAARGSGLGLAFCKLVVEQLGGRIWADRSPLGGTRIAFELPCAVRTAAAVDVTALAPGAGASVAVSVATPIAPTPPVPGAAPSSSPLAPVAPRVA